MKIENDIKYYILGFICADGNLDKNETKISIRTSDYELALQLFDYISDKEKRIIYKQSYEKETFNDSYMILNTNTDAIKSLKDFGITSNKSLSIKFPKIPNNYLGAFIRGYFDGDGSIYISNTYKNKKYYAISFTSGSELFLEDLKIILKQQFNIESSINKDYRKENSFYLRIYKQEDIIKMKKIMYDNSLIKLHRKYNIFMNDIV